MHARATCWLLVLVVIVSGFSLSGSAGPVLSAQSSENGLLIWVDEPVAAGLEEAITRFEEDTGIGIDVRVWPRADMQNTFLENPANPENADILLMGDNGIGEGLFAPIDLGERAGEYLDFTINFFTTDGVLYGIPYMVDNVGLVHNTDYVPDAPQTWNDVREICQVLHDDGILDHPFVMADYEAYHFFPIMTAFGGYVHRAGPDGSLDLDDVGLGSPGTIAALEWLAAMSEAGLLPTGLDWGAAHSAFAAGQAAFIITGPWARDQLMEGGVPLAVSKFPAGTQAASPFLHVYAFVINAHSGDTDAAHMFLANYVANEPTMRAIAAFNDVAIPTHYLVLDQLDDPFLLGFGQAAANGQRVPPRGMMDIVWGPWQDMTQAVREGRQPPELAAIEAAQAVIEAAQR